MAGMILHALAQWSWLILARLAGILTGFVMVALAIPFRVPTVSLSDGRQIVNLPRWAGWCSTLTRCNAKGSAWQTK